MAITIQGDNKGIAVDGNLTIQKLDFVFGQGARSASGVSQDVPEPEVVEAEEIPVVNIIHKEYPNIKDVNRDFFEKAFVVTGEVNGIPNKKVLDLPIDDLLHRIYDLTTDWNPTVTTSVHKWKVLYETLRRQKYFFVYEKHKFKDFVEAVVRYCFPLDDTDIKDTYQNNISKSKLDEHFENWSNEDKKLYMTLKTALTFG